MAAPHSATEGRKAEGRKTKVAKPTALRAEVPKAKIPLLKPVVHSPVHEQVYERIRETFAAGQVVPGQRIVIRDLALALGTSMMPVRDALRRLEAENAVVLTSRRTLAVPSLSAKDYEELCMIRSVLEGLAAQEAAKNIAPDELDEVERFADLVQEAADAKNSEAATMYNRYFHRAVNAASHRPLLTRIIESLWLRVGPQIAYSVRHDILGGDIVHSAFHPHRQVVAALRSGDGISAATAIAYDITRAGQIIIAKLKQIESGAQNDEGTGGEAPKTLQGRREGSKSGPVRADGVG